MGNDKNNEDSANGKKTKEKSALSKFLDTLCKLLGPIALIIVALIANSFQSKMSATSIITQREQAESQLRASMFSNLIDPIAGKRTGEGHDDIERIKLLTELLVLNFHEHFEFKPLLEYVANRIDAEQAIGQPDQPSDHDMLASLHSVARRVINKQTAHLIKEGGTVISSQTLSFQEKRTEDGTGVVKKKWQDTLVDDSFDLAEGFNGKPITMRVVGDTEEVLYEGDADFVGRELIVYMYGADWDKEQFKISFMLSYEDGGRGFEASKIFTLTWFDFPLTDNHFLKDGNRFSIILDNVDPTQKTVSLRIIWFPKHYFTMRERPITTKDFLDKLGLETNGKKIPTKGL